MFDHRLAFARPAAPACLLAVLTAACASPLASIGGDRALERRIGSYYNGRAMEADARCPNPRIDTIARATPTGTDGDRRSVLVRYHWTDDTQTVDLGNGGSKIACTGWGERTFTLAPAADGTLAVTGMTGLQKRA